MKRSPFRASVHAALNIRTHHCPTQGSYVGFRSSAAANRFVQPRRKAPHKLVFFNHNCGVWEQWEVLTEDAWRLPWAQLPILLRSRRLPQVRPRAAGVGATPGPSRTATQQQQQQRPRASSPGRQAIKTRLTSLHTCRA